MSKRTFKVSRARAFIGATLADEISKYTPEELEALVTHMEEFYASEEEAEAQGVQSPEGEGLERVGPGEETPPAP
jgi:hypothetical protein